MKKKLFAFMLATVALSVSVNAQTGTKTKKTMHKKTWTDSSGSMMQSDTSMPMNHMHKATNTMKTKKTHMHKKTTTDTTAAPM